MQAEIDKINNTTIDKKLMILKQHQKVNMIQK